MDVVVRDQGRGGRVVTEKDFFYVRREFVICFAFFLWVWLGILEGESESDDGEWVRGYEWILRSGGGEGG